MPSRRLWLGGMVGFMISILCLLLVCSREMKTPAKSHDRAGEGLELSIIPWTARLMAACKQPDCRDSSGGDDWPRVAFGDLQ